MTKATTLPQVIRNFNPLQPLKAEKLKEWYVGRSDNQLNEMKTYLQGMVLSGMPVKLLFTGHVGGGKSTELNKLAEALKKQFFIVSYEARDSLNIADMRHTDLLLGMAMALFGRATEPDVLGKAPAQIAADYWTELRGFIQNTIFGPAYLSPAAPKSEASLEVNVLAAKFQAKFAGEAATRQRIREHIEPRLTELRAKIDEVADLVETTHKRPVLFFVEGTDKADLARAKDVFLNYTYSLTSFRPSVIYTFPIGLRYDKTFRQIEDGFDKTYVLPNIKIKHRDNSPAEDGLDKLRQVVLSRMERSLIEDDALQNMAEASGGLLRTLIRLAQSAAVKAQAAGKDTISLSEVTAAIAEERADFVAGLKEDDYPILLKRHRDKRLSADESIMSLLQIRALLEYTNLDPWCDVHPIALPLVLKRSGAAEETNDR